MTKKMIIMLVLLVVMVISGCMVPTYADEYPTGLLEQKYESYYQNRKNVAPDNKRVIVPSWKNGKCSFTDADGKKVYSYTPYSATVETRARVLVDSEHLELPEGGNYYDRLYASKSVTSYKFKQYMTNGWAKASSYYVSNSTTIGWTHSGGLSITLKNVVIDFFNLSRTKTTESSVGTTIEADATKYSKLGLFAKYDHCDIELISTLEKNGTVTVIDTETGTTETPNDYRLDPVYEQ